MMMSGLRMASLVMPLAMMAACSTSPQTSAVSEPPGLGDQAPGFSLTSADGSSLDLSEFRGKSPVLLYFSMGPG